ncbi:MULTISPECIES: hypothetical protein, partial [unclassified Vibrio]
VRRHYRDIHHIGKCLLKKDAKITITWRINTQSLICVSLTTEYLQNNHRLIHNCSDFHPRKQKSCLMAAF